MNQMWKTGFIIIVVLISFYASLVLAAVPTPVDVLEPLNNTYKNVNSMFINISSNDSDGDAMSYGIYADNPTMVTIKSTMDSYISGGSNGNTSYGATNDIFVGSTTHGLVWFNLSSLVSSYTINNATLRLSLSSVVGGADARLSVHELVSSWNEGTATGIMGELNNETINGTTWNERWFNQSWIAAGGDFNLTPLWSITQSTWDDNIGSFIEWVVTSSLKRILAGGDNFGLLINSTTNMFGFDSSDYSATYAPALRISFVDNNYVPITLRQNTTTTTYNLTDLINGRYYLYSVVGDGSGTNTTTSPVSFVIDTVSPVYLYNASVYANNTIRKAGSFIIAGALTEPNFANITYYLYNDTFVELNKTISTTSTDLSFNFSTLPNGRYFYKVSVTDLAGNTNATINQTFVLGNNVPTSTVNISSNDNMNTTLSNLTCGWTFSDVDAGDTEASHEIRWFNISGADNLEQIEDRNATWLNQLNTTHFEQWFCSVRLNDGTDWGSWYNSSTLTILDTMPLITVNITSTEPLNKTGGNLSGYINTYTDTDGDAMTSNQTRWYKNLILNESYNNWSIVSYYLTGGENTTWMFSARAYGYNWSTWTNSSILTIKRDNPSVWFNTTNSSWMYNTQPSYTFWYYVNDSSNISNCYIYKNESIMKTESNANKSNTNTYTMTFDDIPQYYLIQLNCTDIYNNTNSTRIAFEVRKYTVSGDGGGSGDGAISYEYTEHGIEAVSEEVDSAAQTVLDQRLLIKNLLFKASIVLICVFIFRELFIAKPGKG